MHQIALFGILWNFPIKSHVRLLVGLSVHQLVSWFGWFVGPKKTGM